MFIINSIRQWYSQCFASLLEAGRVVLSDRNWDEQAVSGRLHVHLGRKDTRWGLLWPQVSETPGSPCAFVWCLLDLGFPVCFSAEPLDPAALSSVIMVITTLPSSHRSGAGKWSTIIWWNLSFSGWALGCELHTCFSRGMHLSPPLNERKVGSVAVGRSLLQAGTVFRTELWHNAT